MSQFCVLFLTTCLVVLTIATPIKDGEDVGLVEKVGKRIIVTGQKHYPFMAYIKFVEKEANKRNIYTCGGVVIGRKTVLTAAHCILNRHQATIHVHAGIVDKDLEAKKGQNLKVVNMLAHEGYQESCKKTDSGKCCLAVNDIGILWLKKPFVFGPTVQKAKLSLSLEKPFFKEGWILGWGLNSLGKLPAMLQRGQVKVILQNECDEFNPKFKISDKMICVSAVNGGTRARSGDSGAPLVINEMVYGLSSTTVLKDSCNSKTVDLYTFIPAYSEWIQQTLKNGPPKKESSCTIC